MQQRLLAAGFAIDRAELGSFGSDTGEAVGAFQTSRGLLRTGVVDDACWAALVEAGWHLGDRLLYLRSPMLRGDDVGALQQGLGALGFDAGRVDAIFGPQTETALKDFQRNAGLTTDGVCGPEVVAALGRLGGRTSTDSVAGVRERERLRRTPTSLEGRRVVIGEQGGLGGLSRTLGRTVHDLGAVAAVLHHPDASAQAHEANSFEAEAYVGLTAVPDGPCRVAYYATEGFRSEGGAALAGQICRALREEAGMEVETPSGLRLPVLRETRMPAVLCLLGPASTVVERSAAVIDALATAVQAWFAGPIEL